VKKAVMYGAGNIGRGFIGYLFRKSGYEVVFIDINPVIIEKLNSEYNYPVRIVSDGKYQEETVDNVRAVNAKDIEKVVGEIESADIMATAVGVNVLPKIAEPIARGIVKRWEKGNNNPLNIIICENLINANKYLEGLIKKKLDDKQKEQFDRFIGLVEASIGRMVPVMTDKMQEGNPLRVWVEPYSELPVDRDGFKGEIPDIVNMVPFSPFDFYIQRKLYMHNMGHAVSAYLGFIDNSRYIWESVGNPFIKIILLRVLQESAIAMSKEHNEPLDELLNHSEDLIYRFGNRLLGDTVERVGRDPVRKLSENDRLAGAARLCVKNGINPVYISIGLAAGFVFAPPNDENAAAVQQFIDEKGIEVAVEHFCGFKNGEIIVKHIIDFFRMINRGEALEDILKEAEGKKHRQGL
jgi:mannitol-1-phosphate 5-dehydrogenase